MCLPALRALKAGFPAARIYVAARKHLCDIYLNLDELEGVIPLPGGSGLIDTSAAARLLRTYHFDSGLLFTNSFQSALLFKWAGIKQLTGYSKDLRGFLLSRKRSFPAHSAPGKGKPGVITPGEAHHHIHFYLDLVDLFSGRDTEKKERERLVYRDRLAVTPEEKRRVTEKLATAGSGAEDFFIGISPSAAYGTAKQWLPERFGQLIRSILGENKGARILLLGTEPERERIEAVIVPLGEEQQRILNLAGRFSLREALVIISLCKGFISNDSGLMHAAAAMRVPTLGIFGPTEPHKTSPLVGDGKKVKVLHHPVECSPCTHRQCPIDHRCMTAVTVEEAWRALRELVFRGK